MDRFDAMQAFVRVVEVGSFSGAAERLGVTKSVVSRRVADLERALGAELLRRTTRRLHLTDSGRAYYERARRILADLAEAEQAVSSEQGALRGELRVAAPLSFGIGPLQPAIEAFQERHPEVTFDLDLDDRQVDLVKEGVDVAVRIANLEDSTLVARRLAPIRGIVCASPDYLARHGTPETPEQLAAHPALVYTNRQQPEVWPYTDPSGRAGRVRVTPRLRANNGDFLREAALAGQGVLYSPLFILHRALEEDRLVPILADYRWPEVAAYAVYPRTRHLSARVRAFVDFLAERFAGAPYWERAVRGDAGARRP
ncbi:MAG: LysR substrate-binding domain-containing protein [Thiohalorhabdus sp.]